MDEEQAQRQIQQMCNFILNEAKDKAQEIEAKALEDFNIEKLKLVQQMKDKIRQEYLKKAKQMEVERGVARSTAVNKARLKKITARQQVLKEVYQQTQEKLVGVSKDQGKYKTLLVDLITQGLIQMLEPVVVVLTREVDKSLVESILNDAATKYSQILKKECNVDFTTKLSLNTKQEFYLPPPPYPENTGNSCCGGVKLMTPDGRIVCDNTLDARLSLVVRQSSPHIRKTLFPSS